MGLDYKIIQKCFYQKKIVDRSKHKYNIFVCLGSGTSNFLLKVKLIKFLLGLANLNKIFFIASKKSTFYQKLEHNENFKKLNIYENITSKDIARLMKKSRFGICTASNISLESYTANLPMLLTYNADNHLNVYKGLTKSKVAIGIGKFTDLNLEKLNSEISRVQEKDYINFFISISKKTINLSSRKKLLNAILS